MYPNPMPFPIEGLDALYVETESYFAGHDVAQKKRVGREQLRRFEGELGRRGRFLDIGCGRGEYLWAARVAQARFSLEANAAKIIKAFRSAVANTGPVCPRLG